MKAACYEKFGGPIQIRDLPDPGPANDGVVVKVEASGLCLSDWHGWMGHDPDIVLPHVPGHELAGTIVEVGKNIEKFRKGDRITVPFVGGCGACEYCINGDHQVCENQFQPGFTAWGSFAEYVAIDYADTNLVKLPEDFDYVSAASLGCRFITAYRALKDQARLLAGQTVAIHGCGGVGLSAIQIAKALGANVIAVDIIEEKCRLAADLGADFTIDSSKGNVMEAIKDMSNGGVHVSIDALGHPETCFNSILSLRKRGKHVQVGLMTTDAGKVQIPMSTVIANELEILGSHGMPAHKYSELFELIKSDKISLDKMISNVISLEEIPEHLTGLHIKQTPGISVVKF